MKTLYRIGQIVPSSNITMETEIPAMLQARQLIRPERFAFHSSRMRMNEVSKDELAAMDDQSDRCALELSDAHVDVMGYACLVAIMSRGLGYHRASQERLERITRNNNAPAPIVTSAGALVDGLKVMRAKKNRGSDALHQAGFAQQEPPAQKGWRLHKKSGLGAD